MRPFLALLSLFVAVTSSAATTNRIENDTHVLAVVSIYEIQADGNWTPKDFQRESIEKAILEHFEEKNGSERRDIQFIRDHIKRYTIEYAGIKRKDKKSIFCLLHLFEELDPNWTSNGHFTLVNDGGPGVVFVEYDPETESIISLGWHGEA